MVAVGRDRFVGIGVPAQMLAWPPSAQTPSRPSCNGFVKIKIVGRRLSGPVGLNRGELNKSFVALRPDGDVGDQVSAVPLMQRMPLRCVRVPDIESITAN